MKLISGLIICQLAGVVWAQMGAGTASSNGVSISYETRIEPPTPGVSKTGGGTLTAKNVIKRHLCDFEQKTYFGYDLTMASLPNGQFKLTFSPLSITPQEMDRIFDEVKGWRFLGLPQQPATQILRAGDVLALDLFVNPSTGQKIVEYLTIQGGQGRSLSASGPSRDFSVEDAILHISQPQLSINGKTVPTSFGGSISGAPIWIYMNGRGRFVFTLRPRMDLGFRKDGEIRGSTMSWKAASDEFSLSTNRRIAPGEGAYNLYVFHDSAYRPKDGDAGEAFLMGGGGRLESLVRR